jgi:antitoxin (DNA-binding transcriptional repressor) of toxin-antitoxin stability system
MQITATELKLRLGYYLEHVSEEDIWISKNGKTIAKLVNPNVSAVDSISGILKDKIPESTDAQDLRDERILKYEIHD